MNKLWVFGDSFSYGTGINFTLEENTAKSQLQINDSEWNNYSAEEKERAVFKYSPHALKFKPIGIFSGVKIWGQIVADTFGLSLANQALPGFTHEQILKRIIYNLPLISKGDMVIVGTTRGQRMWVPIGEFDKSEPKMGSSCAIDVSFEFEKEYKELGFYDYSKFTKEQYLALVDYRYKVLAPYQELVEEEWGCIYDSIFEYLKLKDVLGFRWKSERWDEYESFSRSKYQIKDGHWSPQGNLDFAKWILYMINHKMQLQKIV